MRKLRNIVISSLLMSLILAGIVGLPTAVAQDTALDPGCLGDYNAVINNCTVPAGTIALTEVVDRANGTITLTSGELDAAFPTGQDRNAWVIDSIEKAAADAVTTADARLNDPAFAGYIILVNGEEYPVSDTTATASDNNDSDDSSSSSEGSFTLPSRTAVVSDGMAAGDTVKDFGDTNELLTFPAGTISVVRITDNSTWKIFVDVVVYEEDTIVEVGPGMRAVEGWYNYQSDVHAYRDACKEANARFLETLNARGDDNWNGAYLVYFNGEQMTAPADCS